MNHYTVLTKLFKKKLASQKYLPRVPEERERCKDTSR